MRAISLVLLLCLSGLASAANRDFVATFDAPIDGGPVEGYHLYQGCDNLDAKTLIGEVTSGQTLSADIAPAPMHYFCVVAYNAVGAGPVENVISLPGQAPGSVLNFRLQYSTSEGVTVTVATQPAP